MSQSTEQVRERTGFAGVVARAFVDSKLTPLVVIVSILLGMAAVFLLPREEEPQIKVPMIDVLFSLDGADAREVEELITRPTEKLMWEIPGVDHVYSISRPGESLIIVRFKVGEDLEKSLVHLHQKAHAISAQLPSGASLPLIKPRSIDDVPVLALTFHSPIRDHLTLRRLVAQIEDSVKQVPQVAETVLIGGARRQLRVLFDPARLASRGISVLELASKIQKSNRRVPAGSMTFGAGEVRIEAGAFLADAREAGGIVVGVHAGKPVYLREVAEIRDGADEAAQHVFFGIGAGANAGKQMEDEPAVTLSVAKRPGANAIDVARKVMEKIEAVRGRMLPADVSISVTRDYGGTAAEKSNELLLHMGIAVAGVSLLILIALGWRESLIVALAIPSTLALTLTVFLLNGYTLNRITLFALIFSIGILVDDAIVVVENMVRHFRMPRNAGRDWRLTAVEAVNEVGNPTILATFAVMAAVLPMGFVGGLMGPYMRPIPTGASAAMIFSLLIAFIVTPWACIRILRWGKGGEAPAHQIEPDTGSGNRREDFFTRVYRRAMGAMISHSKWRVMFLVLIVLMLLGAMSLMGIGWVKVKMLPFDNKSEFQIVLNMPEGTALEETVRCAREITATFRNEAEVADYQIYAGTAAPFNFNGLVRHYFMRRGSNVADIQVNLLSKERRKSQSHEIAKRIRPAVSRVASRYDARATIAEVPPGPPVLQTLVAEIYGPDENRRLGLARKVIEIFRNTKGVVDTDWYFEAPQRKLRFVVDQEKAALHGISSATVAQLLRVAAGGLLVDRLHLPNEKEPVEILLQLPRSSRVVPDQLLALHVRSGSNPSAPLVPLRELVRIEPGVVEASIHHKDLMPVTYVLGDVAGEIESPVYAILAMNKLISSMDSREFGGSGGAITIHNSAQPFSDSVPSMKWDGEWQITLEVFRDLGTAFAAVLVLIFILMVGWFRSFLTPLVVMAAIPFSLVGILPAHGLMGAFFTATSMIGFMAGAGIVVRNSIILVDFIEQRVSEGMPLAEAVVDAGAVRFRPMVLTALAVVVGASIILADPIFQGLAIALMAGEIASLLISRMAVPILYFMVHSPRTGGRPE